MVKFQIKTFNSVYKYKIYICHKILYLPKIMSFAIEETGHNWPKSSILKMKNDSFNIYLDIWWHQSCIEFPFKWNFSQKSWRFKTPLLPRRYICNFSLYFEQGRSPVVTKGFGLEWTSDLKVVGSWFWSISGT